MRFVPQDVELSMPDKLLLKALTKLLLRVETFLVCTDGMIVNPYSYQLDMIKSKLNRGKYFCDLVDSRLVAVSSAETPVLRTVDWDAFYTDMNKLLSSVETGSATVQLVLNELDNEKAFRKGEEDRVVKTEKVRRLKLRNQQPAMPGKWHRETFQARKYEPLTDYVVTTSVSEAEAVEVKKQLVTPLHGFLGQAYNYDDHDLTEEWMLTFRDTQSTGPSDDDVIRTQIESLMEIMKVQVQDRVCTESGVLDTIPLSMQNALKEVPVWGIDSYTRRMVELAIEDRLPVDTYTKKKIAEFIEKALLPSINEQPPAEAYNMTHAVTAILNNSNRGEWRTFAVAVLDSIQDSGIDIFRVHPKGTGVICTRPEGIPPHVFVTEYLGEIYPPYRWCERMDVVDEAQKAFELKPTLPDFYNILLERPRQDPDGYGLLYVDASQKANLGSSCSHSCDPNCTSAVVARNGKLVIALTTNRHIHFGEELTMDYYSVTTSDIEWRAAICLCGMSTCRGSFLHYATQDDLQQVLTQNCGTLYRYASLLKSSTSKPLTSLDQAVLERHGLLSAALGNSPPLWMKKFVADNLRFVEYERKALPCALLRPVNGKPSAYSFAAADMDARCVMEQRIQSLICCASMIQKLLSKQPEDDPRKNSYPVLAYTPGRAAEIVWEKVKTIVPLIRKYLLSKLMQEQDLLGKKEDRQFQKINSTESSPSKHCFEEDDGVCVGPKISVDRLSEAVTQIENILAIKPKGLNSMKIMCMDVRKVIISIEDFETRTARLGQLADILAFWAHTTNFSHPQEYESVHSDPITVVARDLGTSVLRSKVLKNDGGTRRRSQFKYSVVDTLVESSQICDNIRRDDTADSNHSTSRSTNDFASRNIIISRASMESTNTDKETDDSFSVVVDEESVKDQKQGDSEEEIQFLDCRYELADDGVTHLTPISSLTENCILDGSHARGNSKPEIKTSLGKNVVEYNKEQYLDPNEPVYIGSKSYPPQFTFWQLIGWYNAGTDNKIDAPDLFGCVQLPDPSACFGTAEILYTQKHREELFKQLRSYKKQSLQWSPVLKACFSIPSFLTSDKSKSLPSTPSTIIYGSPMLDGALGQVDAVNHLLQELDPKPDIRPKKKKSNGDKESSSMTNSEQFDDILPPELPTSWVQCEACRKWRRVPWHVDVEALPEEWVCSQTEWDPELASCEVPQDSYDPDRENTLEIKHGQAGIQNVIVGDFRDIFCTTNLVYYVGQVKQIKYPADHPKSTRLNRSKKNKKLDLDPNKIQVLIHFIGWSTKFDEWMNIDSYRIRPHNLHTKPDCTDPREQEKWQGFKLNLEGKKVAKKRVLKPTSPVVKRKRARKVVKSNETREVCGDELLLAEVEDFEDDFHALYSDSD